MTSYRPHMVLRNVHISQDNSCLVQWPTKRAGCRIRSSTSMNKALSRYYHFRGRFCSRERNEKNLQTHKTHARCPLSKGLRSLYEAEKEGEDPKPPLLRHDSDKVVRPTEAGMLAMYATATALRGSWSAAIQIHGRRVRRAAWEKPRALTACYNRAKTACCRNPKQRIYSSCSRVQSQTSYG